MLATTHGGYALRIAPHLAFRPVANLSTACQALSDTILQGSVSLMDVE
jgi:hypothetical protein